MLINDLFLSFLDIFSLTASNICAILGMIKFDTDRDIMPKINKSTVIEKLKALNKISVPRTSDPIGLRVHTVQLNSYKDAKNTFYFKSHRHSFFEVYFVIDGSAVCEVSTKKTQITAAEGDFVLMPPRVDHNLVECSLDFVRLSVCFEFDDADKNELTAHVFNSLSALSSPCNRANDRMHAAIHTIADHVSEKDLFTSHKIKNDILDLISELVKVANPSQDQHVYAKKDEPIFDTRYLYAKKFINDNIRSGITTEEVATNVHLSAKQINRLFLKYDERSVFDYIQQKRCEEAKKLLLDKSLSISEISDMLGFSDEFYFSRFFKRNTGFPPHRFRLMNSRS